MPSRIGTITFPRTTTTLHPSRQGTVSKRCFPRKWHLAEGIPHGVALRQQGIPHGSRTPAEGIPHGSGTSQKASRTGVTLRQKAALTGVALRRKDPSRKGTVPKG